MKLFDRLGKLLGMIPFRGKRKALLEQRLNELRGSITASQTKVIPAVFYDIYLKGTYPETIIKSCRDMYGLNICDNTGFVIWPTFLGKHTKPEDLDVSICSVGFGALSLYDRSVGLSMADKATKETCITINAAINTLVVTNMTECQDRFQYRYWPRRIDCTNRVEVGTLNPTTVSLSALARFGFLDKNQTKKLTGVDLSDTQFDNRCQFILENIRWILAARKTEETSPRRVHSYWSYAGECKNAWGEAFEYAIIPSHFCYEVISKYYSIFCGNREIKEIVDKKDPEILAEMKGACDAYENYIYDKQNDDGGYARNNRLLGTSSFAHSCCALLVFVYDEQVRENRKAKLSRLINYLAKEHKHFSLQINDVLDAYCYGYSADGRRGIVQDRYELFIEAVFLNSSIKAIDADKSILKDLGWINRQKLRIINYIALNKILNRFVKREIKEQTPYTVVEGRQSKEEARVYPIYAVYNVITCMEKIHNNDNKKKSKRYFVVPPEIPFTFALIFLLVFCTLRIFTWIINANTIKSLILNVIVSIVSTAIVSWLSSNSHNIK